MICKFCFGEIEEEATVCPICGKELTQKETPVEEIAEEVAEEVAEEPAEVPVEEIAETAEEKVIPAAKPKRKMPVAVKVVLASLCVIVLALLLTYAILVSTEGTEATMERLNKVTHNLKFWRANDINYKTTYAVNDTKAEKKADEIIATLGNQTLTNGELQVGYWMGVYDFLGYYGNYLSMIGLDVSKPLDEQIYDQKTGMTYQQMFLENALESWHRYAMLAEMAEEAGFVLDEESEKYLADIRTQMEKMAKDNKYDDLEKFVDEILFPGSSVEAYMHHFRMREIGVAYSNSVYDTLVPNQEQIEAYYEAHKAELEQNGFGKDKGNYYDVRHILISPLGDSEAEWEVCRESAQKILDSYLNGETVDEEAFAKLAATHSEDTGSKSNGGLYPQLTTQTNFVESFKNWYLDESRQKGDTGLVKSEHGYHIMYFSDSYPIWECECEEALIAENTDKFIADGEERFPMTVNYKKIVLGYVDLKAQMQ